MLLALGIIAAVSGAVTLFILKTRKGKEEEFAYIHPNYTERPFDYKGVRPHDFIGYNYQGNRVKFYPYNYVN